MASFNFKSIFKKINKKNNSLNNQESDFLNNFGLAEFGSALDMLAAAELTTTNKLKKGYLNILLLILIIVISIFTDKYYLDLADTFRSPHIWKWSDDEKWELRNKVSNIQNLKNSVKNWKGNR